MVTMNRVSGAAAKMSEGERKDLAVRALAGSESITALADEHGMSRNFVYEQSMRASTALAEVFSTAANDDEKVLFECAVTPRRLEQMILALVLIGRASQRGVMEFLRDVMGWSISIGGVHDLLKAAAERARIINESVDLSRVRVGLHDEIFQGSQPVLAGVDAASTYGVGARIPRRVALASLEVTSPPLSAMPNKHNADRRHHIPKMKCRVTNWAEY